jgi:hypothetical protein
VELTKVELGIVFVPLSVLDPVAGAVGVAISAESHGRSLVENGD